MTGGCTLHVGEENAAVTRVSGSVIVYGYGSLRTRGMKEANRQHAECVQLEAHLVGRERLVLRICVHLHEDAHTRSDGSLQAERARLGARRPAALTPQLRWGHVGTLVSKTFAIRLRQGG